MQYLSFQMKIVTILKEANIKKIESHQKKRKSSKIHAEYHTTFKFLLYNLVYDLKVLRCLCLYIFGNLRQKRNGRRIKLHLKSKMPVNVKK